MTSESHGLQLFSQCFETKAQFRSPHLKGKLQIPGGWLADCVRPRVLLAAICGLWSIATLLQGFAGAFVFLFSLRLLVGMFEAPSYPICNRLVTAWFPERERAGAIGCYTSGPSVGLAFLMPNLVIAPKNICWHYLF